MASYYDVLGVSADAGPGEVRKAYHRQARRLHPDRYAASPEPERRQAETEMKTLNEAWTILRNPDARRRYDIALGLIGAGHEERRPAAEDRDEEAEEEAEPDRPGTGFARRGLRVAVALVLVGCIVASVVAAVYHSDDQATGWSASSIAELRFAALNAGLSAPQAECFVEAITSRFGPSEPVDRMIAQQIVAACR